MIRYLSLLRFTELGARNLKKSTSRAHAFDRAAEKAGVTIEGQYWTLGTWDGVLILRAKDEQGILRMLAGLTAAGAVRPVSLRAFTDAEFDAFARQ